MKSDGKTQAELQEKNSLILGCIWLEKSAPVRNHGEVSSHGTLKAQEEQIQCCSLEKAGKSIRREGNPAERQRSCSFVPL